MNLKTLSLIGFGLAVAGLIFLLKKNYILTTNPVAIFIQSCAVILMIWARITFGIRSFHATANTTKGELVTNGPYRWLRHPIYAALIYFFSCCLITYPYLETLAAVLLIITGLFLRMILEERSLIATYPEYADYMKKTKRIIPFVF